MAHFGSYRAIEIPPRLTQGVNTRGLSTKMTMQSLIPATLRYPVRLTRPEAWLATGESPPEGPRPGSIAAGRPGERLLGKRILIVEDEALVALNLQLSFEDEGAEVIGPVQSLMDALEAVTHGGEIDLAVLDVDVAGENVYPVAELLRQRGVPFAFHTGHGSRSKLAALFPGTTTFLKPVLPETLVAHLLKIAK
jgi:CheY-like chemotaxis protein